MQTQAKCRTNNRHCTDTGKVSYHQQALYRHRQSVVPKTGTVHTGKVSYQQQALYRHRQSVVPTTGTVQTQAKCRTNNRQSVVPKTGTVHTGKVSYQQQAKCRANNRHCTFHNMEISALLYSFESALRCDTSNTGHISSVMCNVIVTKAFFSLPCHLFTKVRLSSFYYSTSYTSHYIIIQIPSFISHLFLRCLLMISYKCKRPALNSKDVFI
jgi:hypothetical protein